MQSRYYDPELGRFINADAYASTGQGVLGNNMFAYCLNNPTMHSDEAGLSSRISFSDGFDILSMPWLEGSSGGGGIYVRYTGKSSYTAIQETTEIDAGTKCASFLSVEASGISATKKNKYTVLSANVTVISLDILTEYAELSLFDLGNGSLELGFYNCIPYIDAMVLFWSPSITFNWRGTTIFFAINIGSYGMKFSPDPSNFEIGYSNIIGFSFSIS